MKVKSTKSALLMSFTSLLLCFAMLIGCTFAWFTDSVTSGVNKIQAGNLDVELYHSNKTETDEQIKNGDKNLLFQDVALWEPGAYAYETFTVKNVGTLALKYKMALNVAAFTSYNGHDLTEVLKVATLDSVPDSRADITGGTALKDWSLSSDNVALYPVGNIPTNVTGAASEKTFTVAIYWEPTDHDNDFNMNNGRPQPLSVDLGVQLVATQLEAESDSFGPDYDAQADNTLPTVTKEKYQLFANMSGTINEDLKVEKQGIFEEATVPKEIANSIFDEMKKEGTNTGDTVENNLTVFLNVEETTKTVAETTANYSYDIDMTAVMESIVNDVKSTEKKTLNNLDDFVEIKLAIEKGFTTVAVNHNNNAMTSVAGKSAIPATEQNANGYYNYDAATGILTLWTKSFSPFTVDAQHVFTYTSNDNGTHNGTCQTPGCTKTVTNEACTMENGACAKCGYEPTYYVDATNGNDTTPATVGDYTPVYKTLETAMSQAQKNEVKKVVLLSDVTINETNVAKSKSLISINESLNLDLNGQTVNANMSGVGEITLFNVANGTFTLSDSGNNGAINYTVTATSDIYGAKNSGVYLSAAGAKFVMNGGNVTFTWNHAVSGQSYSYFVSSVADTEVIINDGSIHAINAPTVSSTSGIYAVDAKGAVTINNKQFGLTNTNSVNGYAVRCTGALLTINGGTYDDVVCSGNNSNSSNIAITDGTFKKDVIVYKGTISGGTFDGNILASSYYGSGNTINITGGTFNGDFKCSTAGMSSWKFNISGGTFAKNPKNFQKVTIASGYKLQQNGTTYRVVGSSVSAGDGWTDAQ